MRKTIIAILLIALISATSCTKNGPPVNQWTFKGVTYKTTNCVPDSQSLTATHASISGGSSTYDIVSVTFPGGTYPIASGNYPVNAYSGNGVQIYANFGGASGSNYFSNDGFGRTIYIHVTPDGKLGMNCSGIMLFNANGTDSAVLDLSITQTQ